MSGLLHLWMYRKPRPLQRLTTFIQRGRRGWAVEDTWNFDHYLAKVIAEGVEYLREHNHGYQTSDDHWQKTVGSPLHYVKHDPCNCEEWWNEQLTLIANGFREWAEDEVGDTQERLKETLKLFSEYFTGLWD